MVLCSLSVAHYGILIKTCRISVGTYHNMVTVPSNTSALLRKYWNIFFCYRLCFSRICTLRCLLEDCWSSATVRTLAPSLLIRLILKGFPAALVNNRANFKGKPLLLRRIGQGRDVSWSELSEQWRHSTGEK